MDNILVMGGTQFFGKRLVELLLEEGKKVTIATRGLTKDPFGNKVERLIMDREDSNSLKQALENKSFDLVYDQSCYSPQEALDAAEILEGRVKRYIFTSSQAVYEHGTNHREEDFNPKTFPYTLKGRREYQGYEGYQEAKRAAEAVLMNRKGFETVCVRFPIVIGKDDYTERVKFYVQKISKGEEIRVIDENIRFSYILSDEAARFLYQIGQSDYQGPINAGCKGDLSLSELIAKIEKQVGKQAVVAYSMNGESISPFGLAGSWSINTERAEQLGYIFSDVHQALDNLITYYL